MRKTATTHPSPADTGPVKRVNHRLNLLHLRIWNSNSCPAGELFSKVSLEKVAVKRLIGRHLLQMTIFSLLSLSCNSKLMFSCCERITCACWLCCVRKLRSRKFELMSSIRLRPLFLQPVTTSCSQWAQYSKTMTFGNNDNGYASTCYSICLVISFDNIYVL